jgi:protein O-GlcNAc transferase
VSAASLVKLMQANELLRQGKPEAALAMTQRLAGKLPQDADVNTLMSNILLRMGRLEQSHFYAQRALATRPDDANLVHNLAMTSMAVGKEQEAIDGFHRALAMRPEHVDARLALINILMDKRRGAEALEHCRKALAIAPNAQVSISYAAALSSLSEQDEAVAFLRGAVRLHPREARLREALALAINAQYGADPREVFAAHTDFAELVDAIKPPFRATYIPRKDPHRRLRVALVSPDLRAHSVSFFIEPFLEHFDREQLEVVCFNTNRGEDATTRRLKSRASLWRDASSMTEVDIGRQMSEDRIDIAVDLAGHTDGNSLLAFALRIAPVQVTCIGYPDTTGLKQMDYRIVDSHTDPPDPALGFDARATEKLWRLDPCFLCYRPVEGAPEPALAAHEGVVFGSFNAARKTTPGTARLWSRILQSVPGSRLALKSQDFSDPLIPERMLARFAQHGIGPERIEILRPTKAIADHLALYSRIDIGLDPIPYHGTTTTCEALWMGVPVVTHAGRIHADRVGVSLLSNVGAPELIGRDEDDYVRVAVELASDPARLGAYRATLRQRLAASPICDPKGYAERLGAAFRAMWRAYCGEQGTASLSP